MPHAHCPGWVWVCMTRRLYVHTYDRTCSTCMYVPRRDGCTSGLWGRAPATLPPSRLLTKTSIIIIKIFHLSGVFFSHQLHISLQHNCKHDIPWNCVKSPLKCFTTLNCFLFLHIIFFLLKRVEHHHHSHNHPWKLKSDYTSPFCCCYIMSFQHKCKLYTRWLRLILYLIKQFWLISQSVRRLVGEIVTLLAWNYLLVDWLIWYWLIFSWIRRAIDELMNQSCTE